MQATVTFSTVINTTPMMECSTTHENIIIHRPNTYENVYVKHQPNLEVITTEAVDMNKTNKGRKSLPAANSDYELHINDISAYDATENLVIEELPNIIEIMESTINDGISEFIFQPEEESLVLPFETDTAQSDKVALGTLEKKSIPESPAEAEFHTPSNLSRARAALKLLENEECTEDLNKEESDEEHYDETETQVSSEDDDTTWEPHTRKLKTQNCNNISTENKATQKASQINKINKGVQNKLTKTKASTIKSTQMNKDDEILTDPKTCYLKKSVTRAHKDKTYHHHSCSHCPEGNELYIDEAGNKIRGKLSNMKVEFARHVLENHTECEWAKIPDNDPIWIDQEGLTWWKSKEEMEQAEETSKRNLAHTKYEYATDLTQKSILHLTLVEKGEIKTAKIFSCGTCGTEMKSRFRRKAIVEMREHARSKDHHKDGQNIYLFTPEQAVIGSNRKTVGKREPIHCWIDGTSRWRELDDNEDPPPPRLGSMESTKGTAPLAIQIALPEAKEHACSLCGRLVKPGSYTGRYNDNRYKFRSHMSKYHTLPIVIEYKDKTRQLALPSKSQSFPDYIELARACPEIESNPESDIAHSTKSSPTKKEEPEDKSPRTQNSKNPIKTEEKLQAQSSQ